MPERSANKPGFKFEGRPTLGGLTDLRDENYRQLLRLAPNLDLLRGAWRSCRSGQQDLHLKVLEQSPYTSLVRLTYQFCNGKGRVSEPNAVLRAYHDARQVDVLELHHVDLLAKPLYQSPALENAWRMSLFLSKWLSFCVSQGHHFREEAADLASGSPILVG